MKIIPPEKVGEYLRQAGECGVLPMFYLELTSGLRRGELLALLWTDLNVEQRTISVSKQLGRLNGELVVSTPKTPNSIRTVVIPQQAVDLLIAEHEKHPDSPYLFPSPRTGGMFSPDSAGRIHKTLLRKAGIDESVRFHDLRHTFATLALQNGGDVKTVSSMLGHYSAGFTLDTYTHITTKMQQEAADKMGGIMDAAMPEENECKIISFEQLG
jgi:integrase